MEASRFCVYSPSFWGILRRSESGAEGSVISAQTANPSAARERSSQDDPSKSMLKSKIRNQKCLGLTVLGPSLYNQLARLQWARSGADCGSLMPGAGQDVASGSTLECRSGGIGRRAWFRSMYPQGCGGSSPFFGTNSFHSNNLQRGYRATATEKRWFS